jgi:glycopeptide antibiotics resistance protein
MSDARQSELQMPFSYGLRSISREVFTEPVESDGATRFALEWSLLAYSSIVTFLITFAPFRFRWPSSIQYIWVGPWFDVVANVLLFVPLGFLYWLSRKPVAGTGGSHVFWLAFAISSGIELSQIFQPGRYASPSDVLANASGAWFGALLCRRSVGLLNRQWIGRLGLDLPLMNVVYLLVPLIWLDGLAAGDDPSRSYLTWVLGVSGSVVIAGVYRYGLKQPKILTPTTVGCVAAGWFFAASLPTFLNLGSWPLLGCAVVGLAVWFLVAAPVFGKSNQRRFEHRVLKRVFPVYAVYLLLLLVWPIPASLAEWRGYWGMAELPDDPPIVAALQLLEFFTAFTLLGYMVAESHGRRYLSQARSMVWTCCWCGLAAIVLQVGRGFHPTHSASVAGGGLMLIASFYGAWIYWRQLSWIRRYLEEQGRQPISQT